MAKILIIEDDPYVRRFYERLFHLNNYDVEMAADGQEGISKAIKSKPALILLDIMMPKMDGLEVLAELKKTEETKHCNIVMLTNVEDVQFVSEATKLGATDFIVKSQAAPEKLVSIVEKYLGVQGGKA